MKIFSLSIPKPCHEKWEKFNPTTLGGFCSSCQKEVIDFTSWDEDQIEAYFLNTKNVTCGRFKETQLKAYTPEKAPLTFFQKWIPASALSLVLLFSARETKAQNTERPVQEIPFFKGKVYSSPHESKLLSKIINGTVRDAVDSTTIPGASVSLKGTSLTTSTDAEGKFTLIISNPSPNDTLVVSFIGFETQSVGIYGKTDLSIARHCNIRGNYCSWWSLLPPLESTQSLVENQRTVHPLTLLLLR